MLGEQGKGHSFQENRRTKGQILRGNRGTKTILGNRENKKTYSRPFSNLLI